MKAKRTGFVALVLGVGVIVAACGGGIALSPRTLAGESFTYTIDGNGLDYFRLDFDEQGTGGTFEIGIHRFDFPSAEAEASGTYAVKEWYRVRGVRGPFSWDSESFLVTLEYAEIWMEKADASTTYANDYEWRDVKYWSDYGVGPDAGPEDSAIVTFTGVMVPTEDGFLSDFFEGQLSQPFVRVGDHKWRSRTVQRAETTVSGVTTVEVRESVYELEIDGGTITLVTERIDSEQIGDAEPLVETRIFRDEYEVVNVFRVGGETGDATFDDLWREGNTITVLGRMVRDVFISYHGLTPPAAPSVDPQSGYGENSGTDADGNDYEYRIDLDVSRTLEITLVHHGAFLEFIETPLALRGLR